MASVQCDELQFQIFCCCSFFSWWKCQIPCSSQATCVWWVFLCREYLVGGGEHCLHQICALKQAWGPWPWLSVSSQLSASGPISLSWLSHVIRAEGISELFGWSIPHYKTHTFDSAALCCILVPINMESDFLMCKEIVIQQDYENVKCQSDQQMHWQEISSISPSLFLSVTASSHISVSFTKSITSLLTVSAASQYSVWCHFRKWEVFILFQLTFFLMVLVLVNNNNNPDTVMKLWQFPSPKFWQLCQKINV